MEVTSAEWFDDRCYRIKQKDKEFYIASVTTKLGIEDKPFLLKYYAELGWDEARKRLHEAGDRGKRIHFALWVYLNGGTILYNPWQNPFYQDSDIEKIKAESPLFFVLKEQSEMVALWKLQQFFDAVKPSIVATEQTVYSLEEGIAGTLDMALQIENGKYDVNGRDGLNIEKTGIYICDLKTGNTVPDSAWAQIAAYAKAFHLMKGAEPLGGIVLHTSSTTKKGIEGFSSPMKTKEELAEHYQIFKSLSYVWDKRNPGFGPKVFQFPTIIKKEK